MQCRCNAKGDTVLDEQLVAVSSKMQALDVLLPVLRRDGHKAGTRCMLSG